MAMSGWLGSYTQQVGGKRTFSRAQQEATNDLRAFVRRTGLADRRLRSHVHYYRGCDSRVHVDSEQVIDMTYRFLGVLLKGEIGLEADSPMSDEKLVVCRSEDIPAMLTA